jgi:hypothetical protein
MPCQRSSSSSSSKQAVGKRRGKGRLLTTTNYCTMILLLRRYKYRLYRTSTVSTVHSTVPTYGVVRTNYPFDALAVETGNIHGRPLFAAAAGFAGGDWVLVRTCIQLLLFVLLLLLYYYWPDLGEFLLYCTILRTVSWF